VLGMKTFFPVCFCRHSAASPINNSIINDRPNPELYSPSCVWRHARLRHFLSLPVKNCADTARCRSGGSRNGRGAAVVVVAAAAADSASTTSGVGLKGRVGAAAAAAAASSIEGPRGRKVGAGSVIASFFFLLSLLGKRACVYVCVWIGG
jgi:hypothetical protein